MTDTADIEVEVIGNEYATISIEASGYMDIEVEVDSVSTSGLIPDISMVEVVFAGPVMVADANAVQNRGNAPGLIVLAATDPVPDGTLIGTIILRKT